MMMKKEQFDLSQSIKYLLRDWNLTPHVMPDEIAQHVLDGSTYWNTDLPDGTTLALVRLYSAVVQRREVFLGNVLLNDFLFKALPRAVARANLGEAAPLLNDLENAYILWRGDGDLEALREAYRQEVLDALPDLYFGEENLKRGIHGDVRRMLTFYKCNIEPFPIFVVPQAYLDRLMTVIGEWIQTIVSDRGIEALANAARISVHAAESWRIKVLLSLLSFFYHQDGTEMQGFHAFFSGAIDDGRLPVEKTKAAFGMEDTEGFDKDTFDKRRKSDAVDYHSLAQALESLIEFAEKLIAEGDALSVSPRLGKEKMFSAHPADLVAHLFDRMQIGYLPASSTEYDDDRTGLACRFCGANTAVIDEKNIIGGPGTGNRFNQSLKSNDKRFCPRCALSSYLETKRLGMQFESIYPIPKLYNIIFHYGDHPDWELEAIQRQIDYVLTEMGGEKDADDLWSDLQEVRKRVARQHGTVARPVDFEKWTPSALEVMHQMQQDVQAEVIPLGSGAYRLLVFILPQLRPGSSEGLEFVQKRFSHSRLAVTTLLGFLRQLCNCDGPYYFQSVPRLSTGGFDANTFYIRGVAEQADDALRRYSLIAEFARNVVSYRQGHSQLADWILLAEQVEHDPLAVFSDVLRKSPIRGGDAFKDFRYRRLSNDFVSGMKMVDGTEYLALFEHLRKVQDEIQS
jgi:hypothetical protein